jgi:hypothetical protein
VATFEQLGPVAAEGVSFGRNELSGVLSRTAGACVIRPRGTSDYIHPRQIAIPLMRAVGLAARAHITTNTSVEIIMRTISSAPVAAQDAVGHSWASGFAVTLKRWRVACVAEADAYLSIFGLARAPGRRRERT